jgi:hypothetical protein
MLSINFTQPAIIEQLIGVIFATLLRQDHSRAVRLVQIPSSDLGQTEVSGKPKSSNQGANADQWANADQGLGISQPIIFPELRKKSKKI